MDLKKSLTKGTSPSSVNVSTGARSGFFRGNLHVLWLPALILMVGWGVSYRTAALHHQSQLERLREETRAKLEPICTDLSRNIFAAAHLTEGIASLIAIEGEPSPPRFLALAAELLRRSDTIRNVAIAPDNVVSQVYPLEGNEVVVGFRYAENPEQWPSVVRMMAENRLVVAGPVSLVQGGVGVITRRPVHVADPAGPGGTRYWGVTSTVIDFPALLAQSDLSAVADSLRPALRGSDGLGAQGGVFWGDEHVFDDAPVLSDILLPSGTWQLGGVPMQGWPVFHALASSYLQIGCLATMALAALLFRLLQVSSARRLEIVQRTNAEAALRKSERQLSLIYANISDVLFYLAVEPDDRFRFRTVNAAFLKATGLTQDQVVGRLVQEVSPEPAYALVLGNYQEAIRTKKTVRWEEVSVYPTGKKHDEVSVIPVFDAAGNPTHLIGTVHDITERVAAEMELRRLNTELEERVARRTEELNAAMHRAQESDRLKSVFLATMSHELRTPLNSIIGFTGILLQGLAGPLNAEQTKQLGMTHDSARHLLALINDVLDISKIEAGQLEVERVPFELRDAVENALRAVSPQAQKKGVTLTTTIVSNVGGVVSDRRRVEQILLNLLSNAIKFTEQGEVRLECRAKAGGLEISVHDTGIGIRPEDLGKLFTPFQQLETGLSRRHDGTGLGLAISKNLVHLLGGQIRAESEWGVGSTFTITLPLIHDETAKSLENHREHREHKVN